MNRREIPVANWLLLLAFHWRDAGIIDDDLVGGCDFDHPWEIAARLLDEALRRLWRRGLELRFASFSDRGPRPRGALDLPTTLHERLEERGQLAFHYEDLTTDTSANRVLKAGVFALLRAPGVEPATRLRLRRHVDLLADVSVIDGVVAATMAVAPPRRERTYAEALHVARLVLRHQLVDERREHGRGERAHARVPEGRRAEVFQGFVRGASRLFCGPRASVTSPTLHWHAMSTSARARTLLPEMRLDACVRWPDDRVLVLECKFYEEPLANHHFGAGTRFHSDHLYQLTSYLRAAAHGATRVAGALVYARVDEDLDEEFVLEGWPVRVVALDLAADWRSLREQVRLLALWPDGARADAAPAGSRALD